MKNKFFLAGFLIFFFSLSETCAQSSGFTGGLLLNFNGIQIEGEKEKFWGSRYGKIWGAGGISAGAFVKRNFKKNVYGVFELRYIQKGSIYEFTNPYGNRALELLKLHYMEIPVLVGFNVRSNQKPIFFETGLAFSRMFKSETAFNQLLKRTKTPNANYFKLNDFSWIADLKTTLTRKQNLLIGFRIEYSLLSIHEYYNLRNFDYGIELNYLIFSK